VRDFEALTYQTVAMFIKCTHVEFTTLPRITYDRVCVPCMSIMQRTLTVSYRKRSNIQI